MSAFARRASGASLSFRGPEACPNEAEVIAKIETERGRALADEADMSFTAVVVNEGEAFRLTVATGAQKDGTAPSRTLRAPDCATLVTALTRVVSLVLGPPTEATEPSHAKPASSAAPPAAPARAPARAAPAVQDELGNPPAAAATKTHERPALVALLTELDTSSLGGVTFGGRIEGGRHFGDIAELRAGLAYTPAQRTTTDVGGTSVGATFALFDASAEGCAALGLPGVRLPFCAGMEFGGLRAQGVGVPAATAATVPWVAARLDARLAVSVGSSLRLELLSGLIAPLLHHTFYVGSALVHEIPSLSARFGAGIEWSP